MNVLAQPVAPLEPQKAASVAGLTYVTDEQPGIRRVKRGRGFRYEHPGGRPVKDKAVLARIKRLAIPPAWTEVWIAPDPHGHIQATGRDARGRKQYRYHPEWRPTRDGTKYHRMLAFAKALPRIRARVDEDLALKGLPREKVLATIVRLLETTSMRVGNLEYRKHNGSHGLTTLLDHHVEVRRHKVTFSFRGKHGKEHVIELEDPEMARIVKRCQELPGQQLFQYVDDDGEARDVGSADVNAYLREASGEDFTAKDFRTWSGTVLAAVALGELEKAGSKAAAKRNVAKAIERVAQQLGNTPTICRKCYVHPEVLESYLDGSFARHMRRRAAKRAAEGLDRDEAAVLALLQRRLAEAERGARLKGALGRRGGGPGVPTPVRR